MLLTTVVWHDGGRLAAAITVPTTAAVATPALPWGWANGIWCASGGGVKVKVLSLTSAGDRFHLSSDACCGWLSSSVVVMTSLSGRGCSPDAIQTCQSTPSWRNA